ncbi:hypothetical protein COO60DRAFT_1505060 [Scenedesmus sp. NREL 46B-D3]|nr:hypothetical protein COO60DRAFT_1505060 [Scenedesmus sp. NREL 46B-D3]
MLALLLQCLLLCPLTLQQHRLLLLQCKPLSLCRLLLCLLLPDELQFISILLQASMPMKGVRCSRRGSSCRLIGLVVPGTAADVVSGSSSR